MRCWAFIRVDYTFGASIGQNLCSIRSMRSHPINLWMSEGLHNHFQRQLYGSLLNNYSIKCITEAAGDVKIKCPQKLLSPYCKAIFVNILSRML